MKKLTIPGFVQVKIADDWQRSAANVVDGFVYSFFGFELDNSFPATVTVELPDDFDPRLSAVTVLEKKRTKLQAEFQMALNAINDRISNLQAIGYEATA